MRRAAQLLRRTAPYALTGTAVAACDDDKFTVEKVNVIKIPHLRDQGFPGANKSNVAAFGYAKFVSDEDCVLGDIVLNGPSHTTKAYTRAGPREKLHFDPQDTRCAIVTCGGLCPGLNTVVKNLVEILESRYGVEKIYGIKGGYRGFTSVGWDAPLELTADCVKDIHREGGTLLGTSRGGFDAEKIVEWLRAKRVNQLYVIGGDGTHRGAYKLAELCWEKGVDVSVAGVPKTIDNDIGADSACKLTLTPSTRVASVRRGRAWFLFRF